MLERKTYGGIYWRKGWSERGDRGDRGIICKDVKGVEVGKNARLFRREDDWR